MKILSISFQNINSLRSDEQGQPWKIDFQTPQFADYGLFAITGPTGAGKTTILDAITLSLYGCAVRYEGTGREERNAKIEHIMNRQSGSCFAETVFETNQKQYRARWEMSRAHKKPDGKAQTPRLSLSDAATGLLIDDKKVPDKIEELTGLTFENFTRSVMLAQGKFADFLHAKANDRAALLEKITGSQIYTLISQQTFIRNNEEKKMLESIEKEAEYIRPPHKEEFDDFFNKKQQLQENTILITQQLDTLRQQVIARKNLDSLNTEKQQNERQLQLLNEQIQQQQNSFQKLDSHQKAEPFAQLLKNLEEIDEKINTNTNHIEKEQKKYQQAHQQLQQQLHHQQQLSEQEQQAQHNKILFQPIITDAIQLKEKQRNKQEQFQKTRQEYDNFVKKEQQKEKELKQGQYTQQQFQSQLQQINSWLETHHADKKLNADLPRIEEQFKNLLEKQQKNKQYQQEAQQIERECQHIAQQQSDIQQQLHETQNKLNTAQQQEQIWQQKLLTTPNSEQIEQQVQQCLQQKEIIAQQLQQASNYANNTIQIQKKNGEYTQLEEQKKLLVDKKIVIETQLKNEQSLLLLLISNYDLEQQRLLLTNGHPCPLCGATHHPYTQHTHIEKPETPKNQGEQKQQQKLVDDLQKQKNDLEQQISKNNGQQELIQIQSEELKKELEQIRQIFDKQFPTQNIHLKEAFEQEKQQIEQQIKQLQISLNTSKKIEKDAQNAQKNLIQAEINYNNSRHTNEQIQKDSIIIEQKKQKNNEELNTADSAYHAAATALIQILMPYSAKDKPLDQSIIVANANIIVKKLQERKYFFEQQEKKQTEIQNNLYSSENKLATLIAEKESIVQQMNNLQMQYQQYEQQYQELNKLYAEKVQHFAPQNQNNPEQERIRLEQNWEQTNARLQESKQIIARLEQECKQTKQIIEEIIINLNQAQTQYQQIHTELMAQIKPIGFPNLETLKKALLTTEQAKKIAEQKNMLHIKLDDTHKNIQKIEQQIQVQSIQHEQLPDTKTLQQIIMETEKKHNQTQQELGSINAQIKEAQQKKEKFEALQQKIEQQKTISKQWQQLNTLIGSADGAKFNKFAQTLTLRHLTERANKHLQELNNRYRIYQAHDKNNENKTLTLELEVEDQYHANNKRPMRSLSGGETFLVSLALALGLSDLAGKKTQIRSLFIDEGFGTLDRETLEIAMDALENIQASGKTIGIISHVEALKERVKMQIKVEKKSGGVSHIVLEKL